MAEDNDIQFNRRTSTALTSVHARVHYLPVCPTSAPTSPDQSLKQRTDQCRTNWSMLVPLLLILFRLVEMALCKRWKSLALVTKENRDRAFIRWIVLSYFLKTSCRDNRRSETKNTRVDHLGVIGEKKPIIGKQANREKQNQTSVIQLSLVTVRHRSNETFSSLFLKAFKQKMIHRWDNRATDASSLD